MRATESDSRPLFKEGNPCLYSKAFYRAASLAVVLAMLGLTGCGIPSLRGGPNIFEKIWGCPDCPGELACKCNPDPFCFGYQSTNWKHLGPECNQTEHASETSDPAMAKLNTYDEQVLKQAVNVPRALLGGEFALPVDQHDMASGIVLQSYQEESILSDGGTTADALGLPEGAIIIEGEMPEAYAAAGEPLCSTCGTGDCAASGCVRQRHSFADQPGVEDGHGVYLIEKIFGCPDCPGDLACKCVPDPWCAGVHATNWRVMGNECIANEDSVGPTPLDELKGATDEFGVDEPPTPPAAGQEDQATEPMTETPRPELPIDEPADFPTRPDPRPLENEDIPDLFPQRKSPGEEKEQEVVQAEEETKTSQVEPPKFHAAPTSITVLRAGFPKTRQSARTLDFGPGLRVREVAPASHEAEIESE